MNSEAKIFFIGFNKCGTSTLHRFFKANGYRSAHHLARRFVLGFFIVGLKDNVAEKISNNILMGVNPITGMERYRVFLDMIWRPEGKIVEGNQYFKELHEAYPNAYFIFNDRPIENWLRSRINHSEGSFLAREVSARGSTEEAVIESWKQEYTEHKSSVTKYFAGNDRFTVFNIETDNTSKLTSFLQKDFDLDVKKWGHFNKSKR